MKVCVTRRISGPVIELLKEAGLDVSVSLRDHPLSREELLEFVSGASAIICLLTDKIDKDVFEAAGPQLKVVANYAIGFDNIDLAEARRLNIIVTNTPSPTITTAVAEHTLALILGLAKRVTEADELMREGGYKGWDPNLLNGVELRGKTLGIVGLGRIGIAVCRMAVFGFGMKVLYTGPNPKKEIAAEMGGKFVTLEALLEESDFVTLHVPLTPETRHLINLENLRLMKKTAYLINTSRGPVVSEKGLVEALSKGVIAGAGLDVFENEPELASGLTELENIVLTPHIGSSTIESRTKMSEIAAKNILAVLTGQKPSNLVI